MANFHSLFPNSSQLSLHAAELVREPALRETAYFQAIVVWRDELNSGKISLREIIDPAAPYTGPTPKPSQVNPDGHMIASIGFAITSLAAATMRAIAGICRGLRQ
jgi:hypothetical protein